MLTPGEVAEYLGGDVTAAWVRERCAFGEIPAYKIGSRWRIDAAEFKRWLDQQRHSPQPPLSIDPVEPSAPQRGSLLSLVQQRHAEAGTKRVR